MPLAECPQATGIPAKAGSFDGNGSPFGEGVQEGDSGVDWPPFLV